MLCRIAGHDTLFAYTASFNLPERQLKSHRSGLPTLLQVLGNDSLLDYTVLINQTAIHSLPAVINGVNSALLRAALGGKGGSITLTRHPLPVLPNERAQQVSQETGTLQLLGCHLLACLLAHSVTHPLICCPPACSLVGSLSHSPDPPAHLPPYPSNSQLPNHSLTRSHSLSLTHSLTHPPTHPLIHSLTQPPTHPLTHPLTCSLACSVLCLLTHSHTAY